jgi:hypothetical protein
MSRYNKILELKKMATSTSDPYDEYIARLIKTIHDGTSGNVTGSGRSVVSFNSDLVRNDFEDGFKEIETSASFVSIDNSSNDIIYEVSNMRSLNTDSDYTKDNNFGTKSFSINYEKYTTNIIIERYIKNDKSEVRYEIVYDQIASRSDFAPDAKPSGKLEKYYYCKHEKTKDIDGIDKIFYREDDAETPDFLSVEEIISKHSKDPKEFDCSFMTEKLVEHYRGLNDQAIYKTYLRCCENESSKKTTAPKKTTPKKTRTPKPTPTLEIEPETKIPEDYIFPDFANDPEEESGIGRRKKPQVQPELDTDIDNMIKDVEKKRGFFPTNADVKGIMRGESFINFREQDTRGKEVISEMQKLMRDAGANIQPDGSFGKEMKEKLSNLLSKPISFLGKEQYLKLAEMAHEKGKTNWLIGYVAANEGVSPEEYYELMNNKETRKEMVSALKEEGLGRLRTLIKNRRSARAKGIPRSKRRRFFRR